MFIGHYAASLTARRAAVEAPLWLFVAGAQLLDIVWSVLVMLGVEKTEADPIFGLAFVSNPYSHSLGATIGWALAAAIAARKLLRIRTRDAVILGVVVLSHWFLDLVVHRPDLPLWPGGEARLGMGLWNYPVLELAVEILLFLLAGFLLWLDRRPVPKARLLAFVGFGTVIMLAMSQVPPPARVDPVVMGATSLFIHLLFVLLAWLVEPRMGTHTASEAAA